MDEILKKYNSLFEKIKCNESEIICTSNDLLFMDYYSRLLLWRETLNLGDGEGKGVIDFQNILQYLIKDLPDDDSFAIEVLRKAGITLGKVSWGYLFIYLFIYWDLNRNTTELLKYNHLPAPYDTVIKIFERGGYVRRDGDGTFTTGIRAVPTGLIKKTGYWFLPCLEDAFLDLIDERYKLTIPNPEEVNKLYIEYMNRKTS